MPSPYVVTPRTRYGFAPSPEEQGSRAFRTERAFSRAVNREDQRMRGDATVAAGTRGVPAAALPPGGVHPGMSQADQQAALRRAVQYRTPGQDRMQAMDWSAGSNPGASNPRFDRNPEAEAAANSAISRSPIPFTTNAQNNAAEGAIAASRPSFQPRQNGAPLALPQMKLDPNATLAQRAAALAQNQTMAAPGGLDRYVDRAQGTGVIASATGVQPPASVTSPTAPVGIGRQLPDAQGDALFGQRTSPGVGSVRYAAKGEPAQQKTETSTGIIRAAPMDLSAARTSLQKSYPNIFVAGSPENLAFVNHVKDNIEGGMSPQIAEQHAHENVDKLMSPFAAKAPAAGRSGSPGGAAPDLETAQRQAAMPPVARAVENATAGIRNVANTVSTAAGMVPRLAKGALGVVDQTAQAAVRGLTGADVPQLQPATNAARAVANWFTPKSPVADQEQKRRNVPIDY